MNTKYNKLLDINNNDANKLLSEFCDDKTELFLVGGYIRDYIIGKKNHAYYDYDYVVLNQSAISFAQKFAVHTGGYFIMLDEEYDIARVVMPDKITHFDFAACQGNTIHEDLQRRDLTINSIALKIGANPEIIDINNGLEDIENKTIKTISEKNIIDDPLRTLRIFRFASQLGFKIDKNTLEYAKAHYKALDNIANERIHAELIKLFEGEHAALNIELMREIGFLYQIFPELELQVKIPPNLHHHLCLIDHSIETLRKAETIINKIPEYAQEKLYTEHSTGIKFISLFKIACLLHDIGKPATWEIDSEGKHRFIKHDEIGSKLSEETLKKLKFSKNQIKYISKLIRFHIYPSQLLRLDEQPSEKAINKMFRKLEEETPDIITLAMADRLSAQGPEITEEMTQYNINGLKVFFEKYQEAVEKNFLEPLPKLLTGEDIIQITNIEKGPMIGKIIAELKEAQMAGEVNTREEAINFVKSVL